MTVRSAVLQRIHLHDALTHILYVTPAGQTTLIKSVLIFNNATVAHNLYLWVSGPSGSDVYNYLFQGGVNGQNIAGWSGWVAMVPADRIMASTDGDFYVWISGTQLDGYIPVQTPT